MATQPEPQIPGSILNPVSTAGKGSVTEEFPDIPTTFPVPSAPPIPPDPVPLPEVVAPRLQAGTAANMEEAARPRANIGATMDAAASQWSTSNIIKALKAPDFPPEEYDRAEQFKLVDIAVDEEERRLLNGANSRAEFWYRVDQMRQAREDYKAIGDNSVVAFLTAMADPVWLGLTGGAAGVGRAAARLGGSGRTATALVEAGGAVGIGITEREVAPVGMGEVVLNALAGGAAAQFLYTPAGLRKIDDAYPDAALANLVPQPSPPAVPKPRYRQVTEADGTKVWQRVDNSEVVDTSYFRSQQTAAAAGETLDAARMVRKADDTWAPHTGVRGVATQATSAAAELGKWVDRYPGKVADTTRYLMDRLGPLLDNVPVYVLDKRDYDALAGQTRSAATGGIPTNSNGFFSAKDGAIYVHKGTTLDVLNHEVSHAATAAKLKYGRDNPQTAHGALYREVEDLRLRVADQVRKGNLEVDDASRYLLSNAEEFVAGLFSSYRPYLEALNKVPAGKGDRVSALRKLFDTVRRLLGFEVAGDSVLAGAIRATEGLFDLPQARFNASRLGFEVDASPAISAKRASDTMDAIAKRTGEGVAWNAHKTMAQWNPEVADILMSNPLDPDAASHSVVGAQRAIRADLSRYQYQWEDSFRNEMAKRGAGTLTRIFQPKKALAIQQKLDRELAEELWRRQDNHRTGRNIAPKDPDSPVIKMADQYDELMRNSLAEMKRAGVPGAEELAEAPGYFSRSWNPAGIDQAVARMQELGYEAGQARGKLYDMVSGAIRRANPDIDADEARYIGRAMIDRAIRKGNAEDTGFVGHIGNEGLAITRDDLTAAGLDPDRVQRILDRLGGQIDEAGKATFLKHRMDLDLTASMLLPDGSRVQLVDLFDTDMVRLTDRYVDNVSARAAFSSKGLHTPTDIAALRTRLVSSIADHGKRQEAMQLFDNVVNYTMGLPAGDSVPVMMRQMAAVTQMVGLGSSGLWQITEYSTILERYGLGKSLSAAMRNMPMFRETVDALGTDRALATQLSNVLTRTGAQDVRLRPYLARMEDNFEIQPGNAVMHALQNAKQLVPYLNGMKYILHHQSRLAANLITDEFISALKGGAKAREMFQRYGLDTQVLDDMRQRMGANLTTDVDKWPDGVWAKFRPVFATMMDEAVLRQRTGEIPAFAQFSQLGKFLFTFRSFVLTAHNKLLSGTLVNKGFNALSLMMLYQFPLAAIATQADNAAKGKEPMDTDEWILKSLSQFGSLGLFTELVGVMSGDKNQFGSPGMIPLDRMYRIGSEIIQGDAGGAASAIINATPLLPIIPAIRALGEGLK